MREVEGCTLCGGKAVYLRAYSGERLCRSCFQQSILDKVKRTIARYRLLKYGDSIAVALSGGKDSLSLLVVLKKLCEAQGSKLYAITVDEGIKDYRDEAVQLAKRLCDGLKVPQTIVSFKELYGLSLDDLLASRKRRITACTVCGVLRRRALDIAAEKLGVNVLATAHNLDDVLQTFFINLFSGDLKRVRWLEPSSAHKTEFKVRRIKPFMEIYEEEVAFFAYLQNLPFQTYSCPYRAESIRSEVRSMLNGLEKRHAGIKYTLLRSVLRMAEGLSIEAERSYRCSVCGYPSSSRLCLVCQLLKELK
ncbi:MAG: TIGR00269 family protein [Nitrososphaerota archaeon]